MLKRLTYLTAVLTLLCERFQNRETSDATQSFLPFYFQKLPGGCPGSGFLLFGHLNDLRPVNRDIKRGTPGPLQCGTFLLARPPPTGVRLVMLSHRIASLASDVRWRIDSRHWLTVPGD